jgi:hypothetical protein
MMFSRGFRALYDTCWLMLILPLINYIYLLIIYYLTLINLNTPP